MEYATLIFWSVVLRSGDDDRAMGRLYRVELKSAWALWPRCGYKEQVAYETSDIFFWRMVKRIIEG